MRLPHLFGISASFRLMINDRPAFERSVNALMQSDFDKVIVAHWKLLETHAKPEVERALRDFGFSISN